MLWNGEPVLVQRELRSLVAWRKCLLGMLARLTCQGECEAKTRTQRHDYSVCCILYVLFVTHLRSDARQAYTCLVNSVTVSFVC